MVVARLTGDDPYADAAEARLEQNLRSYDQLWHVGDGTYAMTLKTMADAATMASRMEHLFLLLSEPYAVGEDYVQVRIQLGATVRHPQDTATALLERAGEALAEAEANGCIGPVIR